MLEILKTSKKVIGIKQSLKALQNDSVSKVYLANDADERLLKNIKELCETRLIPIEYSESMKILGKACLIEVGAAVVCLLK